MSDYDLLIIGGGINGVGIARDAAGRGLKILLVEQNDLASATSSKSTKLIHGGLRYLEYYEFMLVRKALVEREILLKNAPHIISPLKFILPHAPHLRPKWMIRLGLFLYDHLTRLKKMGGSRQIKINPDDPANPLKPQFKDGFSYYDCRVDDARLVVLNAMDARERGTEIMPRTRFLSAKVEQDHWRAEIENLGSVTAKVIINAAGPWVSDVIEDGLHLAAHNRLRLVKGSHIIVPRLFPGEEAYILQNDDGRIIFAIPYQGDFTLIGTTDVPYAGDPAKVEISSAEIDYLCDHLNRYFRPTLSHGRPLSASDVLDHFAGVRPLYDDATKEASAVTRDFVLSYRDVESDEGSAPLLSIFGGKITTYRHLAEEALEKIAPIFPDLPTSWTADAPLPGGDMVDMTEFVMGQQQKYPWLDRGICLRLARLYGSRMDQMLKDITSGILIGPGLYDFEVDYLVAHEWAVSAEDILGRRTKLGLHWTAENAAKLEQYLMQKR